METEKELSVCPVEAKKALPACPVETTLMLIGDRWKVLIIRDLLDGTKRFGELKKSLHNFAEGIDGQSACDGDAGTFDKEVYAQVPPKVEYTLTETGYSLKPVLDALKAWGTQYKESFNEGACVDGE